MSYATIKYSLTCVTLAAWQGNKENWLLKAGGCSQSVLVCLVVLNCETVNIFENSVGVQYAEELISGHLYVDYVCIPSQLFRWLMGGIQERSSSP